MRFQVEEKKYSRQTTDHGPQQLSRGKKREARNKSPACGRLARDLSAERQVRLDSCFVCSTNSHFFIQRSVLERSKSRDAN